jgi:hypothetical protein
MKEVRVVDCRQIRRISWGKAGRCFRALGIFLLLPALLLLPFPASIHAQSIFGRVIVAGDTTGVSGA